MISAAKYRRVPRAYRVTGRTVEAVGGGLLRYGLVLILLSSGLAKFTPAEAQFIQPLVGHSPIMAWLYGITSVEGASDLIGAVEIVVALLLAAHRWLPALAAIGSTGGAVMFVITVSFLFTTPNLSPEMLGFLSKDVLLLGIAVWLTGESLRAAQADETLGSE
jgi:uncharacterized membrane protein YkgB